MLLGYCVYSKKYLIESKEYTLPPRWWRDLNDGITIIIISACAAEGAYKMDLCKWRKKETPYYGKVRMMRNGVIKKYLNYKTQKVVVGQISQFIFFYSPYSIGKGWKIIQVTMSFLFFYDALRDTAPIQIVRIRRFG